MLRIRQYLTLVRLTALEVMRQPVVLLMATTSVVLTAVVPMLLIHNFGEEGKLARDSGLAFHFVFGLFIAGYAACSVLSREIASGTAGAVLSKPIGRATFFLAKFAGIKTVVLLFSLCSALATLIAERVAEKFVFTERHVGYVTDWQSAWVLIAVPCLAFAIAALINFRRRRPFGSNAFAALVVLMCVAFVSLGCFDRMGRYAPFAMHMDWRIIPVSILITLALLVLGALALALSTRLTLAPTLTILSLVFVLGLMSDYGAARLAGRSSVLQACYALIPNWQHLWAADVLNDGGVLSWTIVGVATGYALLCGVGIMALGLLSFLRVEVE